MWSVPLNEADIHPSATTRSCKHFGKALALGEVSSRSYFWVCIHLPLQYMLFHLRAILRFARFALLNSLPGLCPVASSIADARRRSPRRSPPFQFSRAVLSRSRWRMRVIGAWCRTYIADAAVNRWVVTAVDPSLPRGDHLSMLTISPSRKWTSG